MYYGYSYYSIASFHAHIAICWGNYIISYVANGEQ